jgi:hypothetical protein
MFRRHLDELDDYEVIGHPVVGPTGLTYVPWIDRAVEPYEATQLPNCTVVGLWDALRRAELIS